MEWSAAELFLAYRQAKHALYQEHRGMDRLAMAREEQRLPALIGGLQRRLRDLPGWFTEAPIGSVWLVPKAATGHERDPGVASIGEDRDSRISKVTVRVHLAPSLEFALVEVLWIWKFGPALEAVLSPAARANRLSIRWGDTSVDALARGPFRYWPKAYQAFRDDGFTVAKRLLSEGRRCLVASFDLTSYYDRLDPRFLLERSFVTQVSAAAASRGIAFDENEYLRATRTLLAAFGTYYRKQETITGVRTRRGIPIGILTSRVIANVALAPLDTSIASHREVEYYARYVDDILLVTVPASGTPRSIHSIAKRYLPVLPNKGGRAAVLLDAKRLGRYGSEFRLQRTKLKGYVLKGRQGRDFLLTIERDVRQIGSERRAFLHPDGLGTDSPIGSLIVGSDEGTPIQVLRDADKLKVGRYAASVALGKVATGVKLLPFPESKDWCRDQLLSLAEVVTDANHWLEFIDYGFRALGICVQARDSRTARLIATRHRRQWHRLLLRRRQLVLHWNGRTVRRDAARDALKNWHKARTVEQICASLPAEVLATARETRRFLALLRMKSLRVADRDLVASNVQRLAGLLSDADLRAVDRESDLRNSPLRTARHRSTKAWRSLLETLAADAGMSQRIDLVKSFLSTCRELGDPVYRDLSPLDVLLMSRPPSAFDVAWRWSEAGKPVSTLMDTVNAIRGTRYSADIVRRIDDVTLDISTEALGVAVQKRLQLVLGNLQYATSGPWSAATGQPDTTRERLTSLARIVNRAIEQRSRTRLPTLLLLPELSVPRKWIRPLAGRLVEEGIDIVTGLEYRVTATGVINEAVGVFTSGRHASAVCRWPKSRPARLETRELLARKLTFVEHSPVAALSIVTDHAAIGTLICSEVLDVNLRASLLGRIDLLLVPSWNPDTATFDHTVQTAANDLHCYIAVANNARFSDCRVQEPSDKRWKRDVCRLIFRDADEVVSCVIDIDSLRQFQLRSIADPSGDPDGFKPIPPGYAIRR